MIYKYDIYKSIYFNRNKLFNSNRLMCIAASKPKEMFTLNTLHCTIIYSNNPSIKINCTGTVFWLYFMMCARNHKFKQSFLCLKLYL